MTRSKFLLLLPFWLICWQLSIAQKKSDDSTLTKLTQIENTDTTVEQVKHDLKALLKITTTDTTQLHIYEDLADYNVYSYPDSALIYAQKAITLAQKINNPKHLYNCYNTLGEVFRITGDYVKAIYYFFKAYPIAEQLNDKAILSYLNHDIDICYVDYGDYVKAQSALFKGYSYFGKEIGKDDSSHFETVSIYLAELYQKKHQLDSAFYYGNQAFIIDSLMHRSWSWMDIVLGNMYVDKGDNSKALKLYRTAILNAYFKNDSINVYNGMANAFQKFKENDSAIFYANKSLSLLQGNSYLSEKLESTQILANSYKDLNKDSTLKFLSQAIVIKDSLFNQTKARQIQDLFFNEQIREQEIKAAEQAYQNKIRLYILIGIIVMVLAVALVLLYNNRNKQKAYNLLRKQKKETDIQKQKVENTLSELKSTQAQLIQSEKMASLGELTAGIAHEIQNPLNFVNNFSEVNQELISELVEEVDKGNTEEVKAIANDIKDNEQKINHHGKRADSIVKGMLQHSRQTKGMKEQTDINALCDEYLRLSYHGLRAKDKSFNADFKTDFDESIGKINIVPQDIGRVLLNLFNNAFYAVNEKAKQQTDGYNPTITVSSKKMNNCVELTVTDNGNGIPRNIVDKIFQPFFTTKPTGQGTGLGLSLAYDIITKEHNGTIRVESKETKGTEFIIQLPITT